MKRWARFIAVVGLFLCTPAHAATLPRAKGLAAVDRVIASDPHHFGKRISCNARVSKGLMARIPLHRRIDCWVAWTLASKPVDRDNVSIDQDLDVVTVWIGSDHRLHYDDGYGRGLVPARRVMSVDTTYASGIAR